MIVRRYNSRVDSRLAPIQGRMKRIQVPGEDYRPASIVVIMGVKMRVDQPRDDQLVLGINHRYVRRRR